MCFKIKVTGLFFLIFPTNPHILLQLQLYLSKEMKIQVNKDNLSQKLSFVNRSVSVKNQLPILANILLETIDGKLILKGTDLEIGIEAVCDATILEPGGITVPVKQFFELISSLSEDLIYLETKENSFIVTSKKTRSVFQTINKDEFPKLYEEKGDLIARLKTEYLKEDLSSLVFAASLDNTKPALSGLLLKEEKEGFLLVATDGYRLSLKRHQAVSITKVDNLNSDTTMIIPSRIFRELSLVKENKLEILMYVSKSSNQVIFEAGDILIVGRLIEAIYPNYEKIIPLDFSASVEFDREEMLKAVKICSIFARDSANIIRLSIEKERIVVSSQTASLGENSVSVEATLTGEGNEIAFNARYLLEALSNINAERMNFSMTGPLNPGVFKIANDESYLHLIMPIRVQA